MAMDWQLFGLVLAGEFFFAMIVAWLTHYLDEKKVEGQTYGLVVLGVAGVVVIAGGMIGWENVIILAACFAVAALPMGVEYYGRVVRDRMEAQKILEGRLDEHTRTDREE